MGKKSSPAPTPPAETSAAQTSSNVSTAIANSFLQNPSEITPDGSTSVNPTGNYSWTDPYTGKSYNIPTFTRTTTLSPAQQAIKTQSDASSLNLATLANEQSAKLQGYLNTPVDLSSGNIENYINDHFSDDFNKQWGQQQQDYNTQLANQGIKLGSTAYTNAQNQFSNQRSSAYDNMYGNQYNNALQAILAERNQPINEITALTSGSQVSQPSFMGANIGAIPTTDNAGIISNYDNQRLEAAKQQQGLFQSTLGGLFGLGSSLIKASDDDAKKDKTRIMDLDNDGTGLWAWNYKTEASGAPKHIGLMASEVEKVAPEAVLDGDNYADGYRRVHYGRAISKIIGDA